MTRKCMCGVEMVVIVVAAFIIDGLRTHGHPRTNPRLAY